MDNDNINKYQCNNCTANNSIGDYPEGCGSCGTTGIFNFCLGNTLDQFGINVDVNENVYILTAPEGLFIRPELLSNAWLMFNQQLPTGSFQGYITSIFTSVGSALSKNTSETLSIILGTVVFLTFVFYAIICVILMAYHIVDVAIGIALIFIGLFLAILALIISYSEAYNLAINIEKTLFNGINPVLDNIACAIKSGICCSGGICCICPNAGIVEQCKNQLPPVSSDDSNTHE